MSSLFSLFLFSSHSLVPSSQFSGTCEIGYDGLEVQEGLEATLSYLRLKGEKGLGVMRLGLGLVLGGGEKGEIVNVASKRK